MRGSLSYARSITILALCALLPMARSVSARYSARPGARAGIRDSLLALDRRWGQAYVHEDSAFVASFVAEDWRGWFDDHADNKASVLAAVRNGAPRISKTWSTRRQSESSAKWL